MLFITMPGMSCMKDSLSITTFSITTKKCNTQHNYVELNVFMPIAINATRRIYTHYAVRLSVPALYCMSFYY